MKLPMDPSRKSEDPREFLLAHQRKQEAALAFFLFATVGEVPVGIDEFLLKPHENLEADVCAFLKERMIRVPDQLRVFLDDEWESKSEALAKFLIQKSGYVPQHLPLINSIEALEANLPLLLEGPRGCGKTAFPEAFYESFNMPMFFLQCMEGYGISDLLYQWDRTLQRLWLEMFRDMAETLSLETLKHQIRTREFLLLGEILAGYVWAEETGITPLIVADEIDKLDPKCEDMFLGLTAAGYTYVPSLQPESRIGRTNKAQPWPIVVFTSNNLRHGVSSPLRSRCVFSYYEPPTEKEEVRILKSRVRECTPNLLEQTIKVVREIRSDELIKEKPGIREAIFFLQAMARKRIEKISEQVVLEHLGYLARTEKDQKNMVQSAARYANVIRFKNTEIQGWVADAFTNQEIFLKAQKAA